MRMSAIAIAAMVLLLSACGMEPMPNEGGTSLMSSAPTLLWDFEQLDPATGAFVGWVDHSMNYSVFQTDDSISGKALRFYRPDDAPDDMDIWLRSDRFEVPPGVNYKLAASVKGATPNFRMEVAYFDDLNQCVTDAEGACVVHVVPIANTPSYKRFSSTSRTPAVTPPRYLRAEIRFTPLDTLTRREFDPSAANMENGSSAFVDDVAFNPVQ